MLETAVDASEPRLLDRVRHAIRRRRYSRRTERSYVGWIRRLILFPGKRHPAQLGAKEVGAFLSVLAVDRQVSASTQNQALAAILFLYRDVLEVDIGWLDGITRAKRPATVPVVLSRAEVERLLEHLRGPAELVASLLYGSGLRPLECLRLRLKDIDFERNQLVVRNGKGGNGRTTLLPTVTRLPLQRQLQKVRQQHVADLEAGAGWVELPDALARKYPHAGKNLAWQWAFPATRTYTPGETGQHRRRHFHESAIRRAVQQAVPRAGIQKPATCHTLRHWSPRRPQPRRPPRRLEIVASPNLPARYHRRTFSRNPTRSEASGRLSRAASSRAARYRNTEFC